MHTNTVEQDIMTQCESYCVKFTRTWLIRHGFTTYREIWEDALQCTRIGLLLYLRQHNITKAEDVFSGETSPYWLMFKELYEGIVLTACAPCGIHRARTATKVKYRAVSLGAIENTTLYSEISAEEKVVSYLNAVECWHSLREDQQHLVGMRMDGMKPGAIQHTLKIPKHVYRYRIDRIKERITDE